MDVEKTLKKARRFKKDESQEPGTSDGKIPSIPNHGLDRVRPKSTKRDLVLWQGIWNREGRIIRTDELTEPSSDKDQNVDGKTKRIHDDDSSVGSNPNCDTDMKRKIKGIFCRKRKKEDGYKSDERLPQRNPESLTRQSSSRCETATNLWTVMTMVMMRVYPTMMRTSGQATKGQKG
jgi:hypothetical protein